jgi:unspecific monooxygenase
MLHRDPEVWGPDAEEFDPDRFEARAARSRAPHTFKPFGTGARACIGRQFALHEATLVLGLLLRRYDLRADPEYRLRVTERLTLMPDGLRLRPERRAPRTSRAAGAAAATGAPEAWRSVVPVQGGGAEGSAGRCPVHRAGD